MKEKIHPQYNSESKVSCACGNTFVTGSTMPEVKTELCSACHPFYTGKQKLVDTARRVEKFQIKTTKVKADLVSKKVKRAAKEAKKTDKNS